MIPMLARQRPPGARLLRKTHISALERAEIARYFISVSKILMLQSGHNTLLLMLIPAGYLKWYLGYAEFPSFVTRTAAKPIISADRLGPLIN